LLLHAQSGVEGPLRMIFVGQRRTEERKDAVAQRLGDIALVAVHGVHHELERRVNQGAASSGSRPSMSAVEPFRSADKAVIVLRSRSAAPRASIGACSARIRSGK